MRLVVSRWMLFVVLAGASLCDAADDPMSIQQRIKAAFLYKFVAYIEWPPKAFPTPASPIVIGVAAADEVAGELARAVAGRIVAGRPIKVLKVERGADVASCCHVLFVGHRERAFVADLLALAQGHPVLTVTDLEGDPPGGSVINFLTLEDRVRFDISRRAAELNGLQLRSQLLSVARRVAPAS